MKKFFYTMIASLFMFSCYNDSKEIEEDGSEFILTADLEQLQYSTRAVVDGSGRFSWTDDDLIGICGYKGSNSRFHHVDDAVRNNVFSGVFDALSDSIWFGYFPYQKDIVINDGCLYLTIEEESDLRNNVNSAPMIGFLNGNNTMSFRQAGGLLHLSFKGFKDGMNKVLIESAGDTRHYLSGTAVMDITPESASTFSFVSGSYTREFSLSFLDKDTTVYDLFVPFQIGDYSIIKVSIIDDNGVQVRSNTISEVIMERANLIEMPLMDFSD